MGNLVHDVRFGLRMLLKNPGFGLLAVITLALGITANTVTFSVLNSFRRPLPVKDPDEIVVISTELGRIRRHSHPDYLEYRQHCADVMAGLAAYDIRPVHVTIDGNTERLAAGIVSGNYFNVLGVEPAVGRAFRPEEDQQPGAHPVAMVSESLYGRSLRGHAIPGAVVRLNSFPFTIIGVVPERASRVPTGGVAVKIDVFVPAMMKGQITRADDNLSNRSAREFVVFGRLRPGVQVEQAQARFELLAALLSQEHRELWSSGNRPPRLFVEPEVESRVPYQARRAKIGFSALFLGLAGTVLLIACTNLANFLLARSTARRVEIAVRLALGASRWQLIRQLLMENVLLAAPAGAAGFLLTMWMTGVMSAIKPSFGLSIVIDVRPDSRVLLFNLLVTISTTLLFGLVPALQATRPDLVPALKEGRSFVALGQRRFTFESLLIVGQVAASFVLLIVGGLFLRSLRAAQTDLGFNSDRVATLSLDLETQGYTADQGRRFYRQVIERLHSLSTVESADAAELFPMDSEALGNPFTSDKDGPGVTGLNAASNVVGPRYFETLTIPLVRGRSFAEQDREGAPRAAIVNEAFASRMWPGQDPIGKYIYDRNQTPLEVVGLTRTGKYQIESDEPQPFVYLSLLQNYRPSLRLLVRTSSAPAPLLDVLRREVLAIDPNMAVFNVKTLNEHLSQELSVRRMGSTFFGVLAAMSLGLAAIGLYGVIAYSVARRTHEIGVRIALGARPKDVVGLIIRQGLALTLTGVVIGLAAAVGVTRIMASMLYGVRPTDPITFLSITFLLSVAALLACYLPARCAAKLDPMVALRRE